MCAAWSKSNRIISSGVSHLSVVFSKKGSTLLFPCQSDLLFHVERYHLMNGILTTTHLSVTMEIMKLNCSISLRCTAR